MSRFGNFGRNTTTVNCQITWKKLLALFLMDTCGISALAILVFSYTLTTPWRLVKARQSFRRITFKTKTLLWRLKLSPAWLAPGNLCPEGLFVTPEFLIYVGTCTRKLFKDFEELFYCTGSVHIITILECSSKDRLCWSSICHWPGVTRNFFYVTLSLNWTIHLPILQKNIFEKRVTYKKINANVFVSTLPTNCWEQQKIQIRLFIGRLVHTWVTIVQTFCSFRIKTRPYTI